MKITIHRALAELKLLDSRITKAINTLNVVATKINNSENISPTISEKDFVSNAKADLQSVTDLMARRTLIKSKILKSNNDTIISIGNKGMSITDAIYYKTVIEDAVALSDKMKAQMRSALASTEVYNNKIADKALELAKTALSKENVKIGDSDVDKIYTPFFNDNKLVIIDPLDVEKRVELMDIENNEFLMEIDAVLSESNATTVIEI